jgi:radical SAM protein with 4Fe4S-binding SPASM domain
LRPCIQPWERINFLYNGDVNICCGDVEGELIVGNIKESSIRQLWYGKRAKEIRKLHVSLAFDTLKVCQVCSGINADWYTDSFTQLREVYERLDPSKKVVEISNASAIVE